MHHWSHEERPWPSCCQLSSSLQGECQPYRGIERLLAMLWPGADNTRNKSKKIWAMWKHDKKEFFALSQNSAWTGFFQTSQAWTVTIVDSILGSSARHHFYSVDLNHNLILAYFGHVFKMILQKPSDAKITSSFFFWFFVDSKTVDLTVVSRWLKTLAEGPPNTAATPAVLVIAPTRELATQIQSECERFAPATRPKQWDDLRISKEV